MDNSIEVAVRVPAERLGEFYEYVGKWLRTDGTTPSPAGAPGANGNEKKRGEAWRTGSEEDLLRDARALYQGITPAARKILDYWLDRNGERVRASDMAHDLGMASTRTVAGTLSSFTKRDKKGAKRGLPFFWEEAHDGTWYWMAPDIADLFRRARQGVPK